MSPGDQLLAARLAALRLTLPVRIKVQGLPRLARRLGIALGDAAGAKPPLLAASALTARERFALRAAGALTERLGHAGRCLQFSLLGGYALRRRHPVLRFGARFEDKVLRAHAWLELDGGRIDLDAETAYEPLRRASSATR